MNTKYLDVSLSPKERAQILLSQLTLKEKVGQLCQKLYGFNSYNRNEDTITASDDFIAEVNKFGGIGTLYGLYRADPWSQRTPETGLVGDLAPKAYNLLQKIVIENSRFGIPMLLSTESPHGHQALDGYLLPVNLAVGATFNTELYEAAQVVCSRQLKEMGVNLSLVSALDVLRDPRWGRSEECFSEDPFLSSEFAAAAVRGMQSTGIDMVAKHFCAQGETTGGVNASAARIGPRELREIHLPSMKACCKENVKGVMAAYNEIDGVYCHANRALLTDILREELGFNGVVMADGCAIDQLYSVTGGLAESAAVAINAGVDIGLWDEAFSKLEEAVEKSLVDISAIDTAALRVLTAKFEQGLFENPYLSEDIKDSEYTYNNYMESLQLSRESVVLLKNTDNLLPLAKNIEKIAVIGPAADDIYRQIGDYSPPVNSETCTTILQGVNSLKDSNTELLYSKGCHKNPDLSSELLSESIIMAKKSDVIIFALGGSSSRFNFTNFDTNGAAITDENFISDMDCGEGVDTASINLSCEQLNLFNELKKLGKPIVTVVIAGRPYAIPELAQYSNSLLYSFYPGPMGGQAIAEILFGLISPSGRLPVSIPRSVNQLPVYYNYKNSYNALKYSDMPNTPLYGFGEGFGYGSFEYSDFKLNYNNISISELNSNKINLSFNIHNTSEIVDCSVPQLYIQIRNSGIVGRARELKAFKKISLDKGQSQECTLILDKDALSIWNNEMIFTPVPSTIEITLMDNGKELYKDIVIVK